MTRLSPPRLTQLCGYVVTPFHFLACDVLILNECILYYLYNYNYINNINILHPKIHSVVTYYETMQLCNCVTPQHLMCDTL